MLWSFAEISCAKVVLPEVGYPLTSGCGEAFISRYRIHIRPRSPIGGLQVELHHIEVTKENPGCRILVPIGSFHEEL